MTKLKHGKLYLITGTGVAECDSELVLIIEEWEDKYEYMYVTGNQAPNTYSVDKLRDRDKQFSEVTLTEYKVVETKTVRLDT